MKKSNRQNLPPKKINSENILNKVNKIKIKKQIIDENQISEKAIEWIALGERGLSSDFIFQITTGIKLTTIESIPYDIHDFRRCCLLLESVEEVRDNFHLLSNVSREWKYLYENWGKLYNLMELKNPDWKNKITESNEFNEKIRNI